MVTIAMGKTGLPIIVYGLLTDPCGRPAAVDVYPGNTADSTTVPDQVVKLREKFGPTRIVLVGDRGMLTADSDRNVTHLSRFGVGLGFEK